MKKHLTLIGGFLLMLALLLPVLSLFVSAEKVLKTDKTTYTEGEDIKITAIGEGNDWVGIYLRTDTVGDEPAIRWYYVDKEGNTSGSEKSIFSAERLASSRSDLLSIPAGEYMVCLCSDDSYNVVARVDITVAESTAVVENKTLKTDKTEYTEGEPLMVTATGDKADWVGIYLKGESFDDVFSIRWYYVAKEGNSSGETKNLFESEYVNRQDLADLPAGEYTVYLLENDSYTVLAQQDITVKAVSVEPADPADPSTEEPDKPDDPVKTDPAVPGETKPGNTDKPTVPQTGVNDHMTVFTVLAVTAAAGASLLLFKRKGIRK